MTDTMTHREFVDTQRARFGAAPVVPYQGLPVCDWCSYGLFRGPLHVTDLPDGSDTWCFPITAARPSGAHIMTGFKARSWQTWHCDPIWDDRCDDLPCKGQNTSARTADGYDSLDESDQVEEYYTMGARALRDTKQAATR